MEIIVTAFALICTFGSFTWGGRLYLRRKKALYLQMIVLAVGCMAISRLFDLVVDLCTETYPRTFDVELLGVLGCFAFFFAANYGQMDSLVDDGSKKVRKYRFIPLVSSAPTLFATILVFLSPIAGVLKGEYLVVICIIGHAMYYNLKHLLIPDVDYGFVGCFRAYNGTALLIGVLYLFEAVFEIYDQTYLLMAVQILISLAFLAVIPAIKKGVKVWAT